LYSEQYDKHYIGYSNDLQKRLIANNHIWNKGYIKKYKPWKFIHSREFENKQETMKFEKYFKSLKNKTALIESINNR